MNCVWRRFPIWFGAGIALSAGACNESSGSPPAEVGVQDASDVRAGRDRGRLFVSPSPVRFGRVRGGEHAEVVTTLTNIGRDPVEVSAVGIVGGDGEFTIPVEFEVGGSLTLLPDERSELVINYDPSDDGADSARLVVWSNDSTTTDGRTQVEIIGNGPEPCTEVSPVDDGTYDFSERAVRRTAEEAFTIRNCSDTESGQPLIVTAIELHDDSSPTYALAQLPELPLELAPGDDREFIVEFSPEVDLQVELGTLEIDSNDPYEPELEIGLTGVGVPVSCPAAYAVCTVDGSDAPPVADLFVLSLDSITCIADGFRPEDGIVDYIWTVVERPDGSTAEFVPADAERTGFFVDVSGRYVFNLEVVGDLGCVSEPASVTLTARPNEDIYAELVWTTPDDPNSTDFGFGAGTDLDLHFVHPAGCWSHSTYDCYRGSREPNWGDTDSGTDNPSLAHDDADGWGPEVVWLNHPESGATYEVGVHYNDDHGYGASFATVRVFVMGELIFEARDRELPHAGFWWEVAGIHWPSAEITPIDLVHDDVPACL